MRLDPQLRVSDDDRDAVVELLHEHRMAGRLDVDEHEERVAEAWAAKYGRDLARALRELPGPPEPAPAPVVIGPPVFVQTRSEGGAAVGFGVTALLVLVFTLGFGSVLSLPLGATAWVLAARSEHRRGLSLAVFATLLSAVALVGWLGLATFGLTIG